MAFSLSSSLSRVWTTYVGNSRPKYFPFFYMANIWKNALWFQTPIVYYRDMRKYFCFMLYPFIMQPLFLMEHYLRKLFFLNELFGIFYRENYFICEQRLLYFLPQFTDLLFSLPASLYQLGNWNEWQEGISCVILSTTREESTALSPSTRLILNFWSTLLVKLRKLLCFQLIFFLSLNSCDIFQTLFSSLIGSCDFLFLAS